MKMLGEMKNNHFYYSVPSFMRNIVFLSDKIAEQKTIVNNLTLDEETNIHEIERSLLQVRNNAFQQIESAGAILEDLDFSFERDFSNILLSDDSSKEISQDSITNTSLTFDGEIIRVFTPLTFNHDWNYSYIFTKCTEIAISNWEKEHNQRLFQCIDTPFVVCVIRKAHNFNFRNFKDNDNKEMGNVLNVIVRHACLDDSACVMNFASKFEFIPEEEKTGIEFVFLSRKSALNHPELVI